MNSLYAREPLRFHGTIPVFSEVNDYTDNYEQISADHLDYMSKHGTNPFIPEELWQELENSTINLVRKFSKPQTRILDVGVGLGRILSEFPNLERFGIDISMGYLEKAQTHGIDVSFSLVEDIPYKDGSFDIILCTDVLEHVLDLNQSVQRMLSVLKSDGVLIVRVPYREDLSPYLLPTYPYKYVHLRSFDEFELRLFFSRIMQCEVIELDLCGYDHTRLSRLKHGLLLPRGKGLLRRFLGWLKGANRLTYDSLMPKLYNPIDINVVVKKS